MRRLGITNRADMRDLRAELLVETDDWWIAHGSVMLSAAAVAKIAAHLRCFVEVQAAILHLRKKTAPALNGAQHAPKKPLLLTWPTAPKPQRVLITRNRLPNPHLIAGVVEGTAQNVFVRVKDPSNFLPRSATGVVLAIPREGVWEFAGNPNSAVNDPPRCPRFRGRW